MKRISAGVLSVMILCCSEPAKAAGSAEAKAHCDPNYHLRGPIPIAVKERVPNVFVGADGFQLLIKAARLKPDAYVPGKALRASLLALGPDDWPAGCLIGVQLQGIRGNLMDEYPINRNLDELDKILKEIGVKPGWEMSN